MRVSGNCSLIFALTNLLVAAPVVAQKQLAQSPRILSAKFVCFNNQTGSDAVGKNALAQLKKWGKFQLVTDPKQADLIFLLSTDPYKGGNIIFAGGHRDRPPAAGWRPCPAGSESSAPRWGRARA